MVFHEGESIRYVALGDSFTEGVGDADPARPNGVRGWADRVAEQFMLADPKATYASLAIRGRLLGQIIDEQVDAALALKPNLVSIYGGGNDILRPSLDIDSLMARYDEANGRLRAAGIQVFTFTNMDVRDFNAFKHTRMRSALYNELLREIVDKHDLILVDYWRKRDFSDWRYWSGDRLHMNTAGHIKMAGRVLDTLSLDRGGLAEAPIPQALAFTRMQLV